MKALYSEVCSRAGSGVDAVSHHEGVVPVVVHLGEFGQVGDVLHGDRVEAEHPGNRQGLLAAEVDHVQPEPAARRAHGLERIGLGGLCPVGPDGDVEEVLHGRIMAAPGPP